MGVWKLADREEMAYRVEMALRQLRDEDPGDVEEGPWDEFDYIEESICYCPGCGPAAKYGGARCSEDFNGEDLLCDGCRDALRTGGWYKIYVDAIVATGGKRVKVPLASLAPTCYNGRTDGSE